MDEPEEIEIDLPPQPPRPPPVPVPRPNEQDSDEEDTYPNVRGYIERRACGRVTKLNMFLTLILIIFSFIYYDYFWIYFLASLVVFFIFCGLLYHWFPALMYAIRKPPLDECRRTVNWRRRMLVGYAGCFFCGVLPQIVAVWFKGYELVVVSVGLVCNLICFIVLFSFCEIGINKYDVRYPFGKLNPWFKINCYIVHLVWGVLLIGYFFLFYGMPNFIFTCIVIAYYSLLYPTYTVNFLKIARYGIILRKTRRKPNLQELIMYKPCEKTTSGIICHSCLTEYDDDTIPRLLITCGHTLCEICMDGHTNFDRDAVVCPFCNQDTPLPSGNVKDLPKNLELVGFLREWGFKVKPRTDVEENNV